MYTRVERGRRAIPVALGVLTLVGVGVLLVFDVAPQRFPARAHDWLGAFPLAMIAVAYLMYQGVHRPPAKEWLKAVLLAVAFVFWAANQCWRDPREATIFNDIAIALFVLDVFLVIIGWPGDAPDESFGETTSKRNDVRRDRERVR